MTKKEAFKTLKENLCGMCAYGSQCMESCDIRSCDNRDAIKALEQEPCEDKIIEWKKDFKEYVNSLSMLNDDYKGIMEYINDVPPVTPRSLNPEADREESKAYCAECDHIEMCSWYPHDGCEWLKTDRYNAGYNAAKREIALSGEYERAYERGKADAHPDINDGKMSETPIGSESENKK